MRKNKEDMKSKSFYGRNSTSNDHNVLLDKYSCSHVSDTESEAGTCEPSDSSDTNNEEII